MSLRQDRKLFVASECIKAKYNRRDNYAKSTVLLPYVRSI